MIFLRKKPIVLSALVICFVFIAATGCKKSEPQVLKMATTTSTDNTGLLDYLKPRVKTNLNIDLQWVAVGTGKALELGKNCDVDVLLVHDPEAEEKYIADGLGVDRKQVMYNDFVIIGPEKDQAKIKGKTAQEAFSAIALKKSSFASRGDKSGTHMKEIALWEKAAQKAPDKEKWYIQTGQGMINTINIAAERDAYTLTDRGTYITYESKQKGNPLLVILVEGDESLINQYSVIAVNPEKCKDVKFDLAMEYIEWMVSPDTQKFIGDFKMMNKQLFTPNAGK